MAKLWIKVEAAVRASGLLERFEYRLAELGNVL